MDGQASEQEEKHGSQQAHGYQHEDQSQQFVDYV